MRGFTAAQHETMHIGRHWPGVYAGEGETLEETCPCPKEPCGHVARDRVDQACPQHSFAASKTIRSSHLAQDCPGSPRDLPDPL